jgi:hypothetical protein
MKFSWSMAFRAGCLSVGFYAIWWSYEYPFGLDKCRAQSVDLEFSMGTWVDCLVKPKVPGFEILNAGINGIQIKDMDGRFSNENLKTIKSRTNRSCEGTSIRLIDEVNRIYEIPYRDLSAVRKQGQLIWSNPFLSS